MKKLLFFVLAFSCTSLINAQGILGKLNKAAKSDSATRALLGLEKSKTGTLPKSLSNEDIIKGLKEALSIGTVNTSKKLNATDGFFADAMIKILMPEDARKVENTLRQFGMGSLVDKAILSMNRAAEDAAGGISKIFIDAITGMTLTDGLSILKGGDFAATEYLKKNTTVQLSEKMRPVIEQSMAKANVTRYWKDVFTAYNKFNKTPVNTDIADYVTEKSMAGIFYSIGQEEQKIRKDPVAQVNEILKKVFGK